MATIKIETKGIGIIYQKDDIWYELLPFDNCHNIKFSYKKDDGSVSTPPDPWAGKNRQIVITVNKNANVTDDGSGLRFFLDICDSFAHSKGVKKLSESNPKDWNLNGVLMKIEKAVFYVDRLTQSRINLTKSDGSLIKELGQIGHTGKYLIEIEGGESVKISLMEDGKEIEDKTKTFNASDGSHTVTFDNDCDSPPLSSTSDFDMIYDVIEDNDSAHTGRKFKIDRHPKDKPKSAVIEGEAAKLVKEESAVHDSSLENTETVAKDIKKVKEMTSTDDPPLQGTADSLPCHKLVIKDTNSSDLPTI